MPNSFSGHEAVLVAFLRLPRGGRVTPLWASCAWVKGNNPAGRKIFCHDFTVSYSLPLHVTRAVSYTGGYLIELPATLQQQLRTSKTDVCACVLCYRRARRFWGVARA